MNDYSSGMDAAANLGFLAVLGGFMMIIFVVGLIVYLLTAIGMFGMAKNRGIENAWLAFIPVGNLYIMAKLAGEVKIGEYVVPHLEWVMIASVFVGVIPFIGWLLSLAGSILGVIVLYTIFKKYKGDSATLMTILSVITGGIAAGFYLFSLRNAKPIEDSVE